MNQKLTLQEHVHDLETLQTGDMYRMQKRLYKELDVCFSSLQSLVQICLQQADGQDPNISLLLGAQSKEIYNVRWLSGLAYLYCCWRKVMRNIGGVG